MRRCPYMMLVLVLFVGCTRTSVSNVSKNPVLEDLLSRIDSSYLYHAQKQEVIQAYKDSLSQVPSDSRESYKLCEAVALEYAKYISDSSIAYYERAYRVAEKLGDKKLLHKAKFGEAMQLIKTGYFVEANATLEEVPRNELAKDEMVLYYNVYKNLYHDIYVGLYSKPELRQHFVRQYEIYRDSLLMVDSPTSANALRERSKICARKGDFEEALRLNDQWRNKIPESKEQALATVLYDRYVIYRYYMGRPAEDHLECLLESAIIDVTSANQDVASLRYVEDYLVSVGRLSDAKKISDYYYDCMVKLGSRSRIISGVKLSMDINDNYARLLTKQKNQIQLGLWLIVVLSLVLFLILWQVIISKRKIQRLNQELERSGKTAKSYVLGFFQLYSSYISRLLALRAKINTNTRKGNTKYVLDLTDPSRDITNEELKQMYQNFDSAFLDIFPDFVKDFNELLRPECRIELKANELLNMELRIFAVIKLGITDSSKISELLHCSIKTVYNKRSEINGKLLIPKEHFYAELDRI